MHDFRAKERHKIYSPGTWYKILLYVALPINCNYVALVYTRTTLSQKTTNIWMIINPFKDRSPVWAQRKKKNLSGLSPKRDCILKGQTNTGVSYVSRLSDTWNILVTTVHLRASVGNHETSRNRKTVGQAVHVCTPFNTPGTTLR